MTQIFDITGTHTSELTIPLPERTRQALADQGIEAPEAVVLHLREATFEEQEEFQRSKEDPEAFVRMMMNRAAPGTDERVMRQLLRAATYSTTATLTAAYLTGELPDPKVVREAVRSAMRTGMTGPTPSAPGR